MSGFEFRGTASDLLVDAWRLCAAGELDAARRKLIGTWSGMIDGVTAGTEGARGQVGLVALKLFARLAPCTDDEEAWRRLPAEVVIYRAGPLGPSWTLDAAVAQEIKRNVGLTPIRRASVAKSDVLALITWRGESEVVVRPESVRRQHFVD